MTNARMLADRLAELLDREHASMAEFLLALAEFDRRKVWVELGYASLFDFLYRELGLSKGAAHYRKTAAELVQRFPAVVEPLRDGRLCITSMVHLRRVLTPENAEEVLPRFFHRSKRDAAAVAAEILPETAAPHRDVVTRVGGARQGSHATGRDAMEASAAAVQPVEPAGSADGAGSNGQAATVQQGEPLAAAGTGGTDTVVQPVEPGASAPPDSDASVAAGAVQPVEPHSGVSLRGHRAAGENGAAALRATVIPTDSAQPLTADLSRLHITVTKGFLGKLEAARAALSHSHPGAKAETILEVGLDLVLQRFARRRGLVEKPRQQKADNRGHSARNDACAEAPEKLPHGRTSESSRGIASDRSHVPAAVKRYVWTRDKGRCQWPLESGGICGSTLRLQCDDIVPVALGGRSTRQNVRLLCAFHNDLAARRIFGDRWMDQFTGPQRIVTRRSPSPPRSDASAPEMAEKSGSPPNAGGEGPPRTRP